MQHMLTLRPASWRDCWRVWRWRNHPSTRVMMRNTGKIGLLRHVRWFADTLRSDSRRLYVAIADGWPVGVGRLDLLGGPDNICAECGIIVAPAERGHGYGTRIVRELVFEASALGIVQLIADVRYANGPSLVAFQRNGFRLGTRRDALYSDTYIDRYARLERRCG